MKVTRRKFLALCGIAATAPLIPKERSTTLAADNAVTGVTLYGSAAHPKATLSDDIILDDNANIGVPILSPDSNIGHIKI